MRTTVTIDDHLLEQAKLLAVRQGRPIGSVLEDALRVLLARIEEGKERKVELPVFRGGRGLRPGVDLEDKEALYDLLDLPDEDE